MYAVYKQIHPPTAVEHSVYCRFMSPNEHNLVIAGSTQLRVYRFILQEEVGTGATQASDKTAQDGPTKKKKFELLGQYSLFGNIQSLKAVQLCGNPRESLLLSFDDAKLAIIEYDPGTHDIKTRSLHYFEDDEMKGQFHYEHYSHPIVRVDPENRCAVMLIYGRHLVVLPFRQEGVLEDQELDAGFTSSGDRSSVLPSYTINLQEAHEKLVNIIDIQFLHGYYEPTLVFLSEPLKTWPGRLAMRSDTCALIALSLNMTEHVQPVIWSLTQLPFDCNNILAVPKPIGGVLVCSTNSLLYLNQSVPPYGVSLNSIAEQSTAFPLRPQEGLAVSLDGSQAIFISSEKLVFALKGGEIYVVTLVADGVRSVRSFNFDKAAASVMTSCICECGDGYLFLGSRLGNSLLVKYTEKPQDTSSDLVLVADPLFSPEAEPPQAKKRRIDSDYTYALDDLDELEVYGKEEQSGVPLTSYTFEVCDSLLNIGPCTNIDIGEPAFLSEEFSDNQDLDLELVTCSGYGKNGALSVLQRSIRPQVVTTFELPGCTDMWTLLAEDKEKQGENSEQKHHSFLLLSRDDSSMVLKTEQEIMELDHSGFSTQYPTVFAGNLGNGKYILQVTPMGVRLLEGINQIQHIPMDAGLSSIVWCSVADPYAVMMTADGSVILLEFSKDNTGPKLTVSRPDISQNSKVCACCAYRDVSGSFSTEKSVTAEVDKITQETPHIPAAKPATVDDEDELLYGDSSLPFTPVAMEFSKQETPKQSSQLSEVRDEKVVPTFWCVLCRENGVLEIYSIPAFTIVFSVRNFNMAPRVLVDTKASTASAVATSSSARDESLFVKEVLLTGVGYNNRRPVLVAVVEQDLLIYEGFEFMDSALEGHLNLRFRKIQHNLLMRDKKSKQQKMKAEDSRNADKPRVASLRVFTDISAYSGVFVCGPYPHWLVITNRGALRTHPMNIDGAVTCFAAFHNVNCPKGFLYFNKKGELRISVLPTHLSYDAPWPVRKVPLRCTAHFVAYNRESKTHVVVTSQHEPCKQIPKVTSEEREFEEVKKGRVALTEDDRFIYPNMDKFYLQLISPVSWEVIPNTRLELEEWEHVTTMKNLMLRSEETHSGMKGFICVGTTHVYGEEITCRGRIIILDIIEVVPEPGQPLTKNKFKVLYDKEQKGPVSALTQVNGFLVSSIGQKIYIWNFKDNDLIGMAFIDTQMYIHTMKTLKNIIVAADINKSITVLRLQEETNTLAFVSKDARFLEVYATDFVIDGNQLGFLVSDVEENLVLFTYQPEAVESCGGQRLLQRADINVGSQITTFFRVRAKTVGRSGSEKGRDLRQLTHFGTLDGAVGLFFPVTEKTYRRLHMLQTKLVECIPHYAGLNPKAFRLLKWKRRPLSNAHRNVLDWELLSKFVHLGTMERLEVTKKIGTTPSQILDDLMDMERACAHF